MSRFLAALLCVGLLGGCTPFLDVHDVHPALVAPPVRTIHFDVRARGRDAARVEAAIEERFSQQMPGVRLVSQSNGADVVVRYQVDDEIACTHCTVDIKRSWYWMALLDFRGGKHVLLQGQVDKFRGAPERFFVRQLADYLRSLSGER